MNESVIDEGLKMEDILGKVMSYIREHLPVYRTWADDNLKEVLAFYFGLGQLLVSQTDEGKINGVLSFQLINSVEERHSFKNDRNSEGGFIDIFIADAQPIREMLVRTAMLASGIKKWIAFERCKYSQRVSKLPWSLAERIASYGR